jgi:TRAP-type C4-dicarboxylate transport system permease small subunit
MKQSHWRIVGGICLVCCAAMALYGANLRATAITPWIFLGYWGLFLILFLVMLYCVLLDLRYIRAEQAVMQREVFRETLGDEEFRRALREAHTKGTRKENAD